MEVLDEKVAWLTECTLLLLCGFVIQKESTGSEYWVKREGMQVYQSTFRPIL